MRKLIVLPITTLLLSACASTPELPPSAGFAKVEFVSEVPTPGAQKLLGWSEGRFYYARKEGGVRVVDSEGHVLMTLHAKDAHGAALLKQADALAVARGTLYVADSSAHRVFMFSSDGEYRGSFGNKGSGLGELSAPRGVAVFNGVVYVSDSGNGRIQLYGDNGVFLNTLEIKESSANLQAKEKDLPYTLGTPTDIDLDAHGNIYVFDSDDSQIKVYDPHGAFLHHIAIKGKPTGFRVGADGIYLADLASYTIQKFTLDGMLKYYFGSKGAARSQFQSLDGLAFDGERKIFVGDVRKGIADVFMAEASDIKVPHSLELPRTSVRQLHDTRLSANYLAGNGSDTLYAVEAGKEVITRLRNGNPDGKIALEGLTPGALATDKDGTLWVIDTKQKQVVHLDANGKELARFGSEGRGAGQLKEPTDIAISASGIIFVADPGNSWVQAFSRDGLFLSVLRNCSGGKFDAPTAIDIDPHDNLYVLDRGRNSISIFTAKGEPTGEFGNDKQQPLQLRDPIDLMATHDEVYVLEEGRVEVFNQKGAHLRAFGLAGNGIGAFTKPSAITAINDSTFAIADSGNHRIETLATLYKPVAPDQLTAEGRVHGTELHWNDAGQPYIKDYIIYRAANEQEKLTRIGISAGNTFQDKDLPPEQHYIYRVAAENDYGFEGPLSNQAGAITEKYNPPVIDNIQTEAHEWNLKFSWKPQETKYVKNYLIYQKRDGAFIKVAQSTVPEYTRDSLTPDTNYTFYVSTVSVDGIESDKALVNATTLANNKAPLELDTLNMSDIFSNTYKLYENQGMGQVKLTNNTAAPIDNIKIAFSIKNFMDFPTETRVEHLAPGESQLVQLKPVFNNNILTVTEDTPVQTELVATYYENGAPKSYSRTQAINVYEKHRLSWSEQGRYAAFITPKDPVVLNYARTIATQYPDTHNPVQWAASIYEALGLNGVTYIPDPNNPYQVTSGATDFVDFVQYPRETLSRKSGDCDDLVALYSSMLESMGITTRVIAVPGHMLMMFSTGIEADADGYTMDGMYIIQDGVLWIPVETTLFGNSFSKAWESGSQTYAKWKDNGLTIFNIHEAWATYKPASLPDTDWAPATVTRQAIEERYPDEQATLLRISSRTRIRRYLQAIEQNPQDMDAQLQAGIVSAKAGSTDEALSYFNTVLTAQPANATALNNRANLHYMSGNYQQATADYQAAAQADPKDALIWVNLAKAYKASKNMVNAKSAFLKAQQLDPTINKRYRTIAMELLGR